MQLYPVTHMSKLGVGKYVLHRDNHFTSLEIWSNGSFIWRPTFKRHVGETGKWSAHALGHGTRVFRLANIVPGAEKDSARGLDAQGGADTSLTSRLSQDSGRGNGTRDASQDLLSFSCNAGL